MFLDFGCIMACSGITSAMYIKPCFDIPKFIPLNNCQQNSWVLRPRTDLHTERIQDLTCSWILSKKCSQIIIHHIIGHPTYLWQVRTLPDEGSPASLNVARNLSSFPKTEGIQKCIKAQSSVRLFWIGVPVISNRLGMR